MNEIAIKKLRELNLKQQLLFVESYLPDAWEYLRDTNQLRLPKFNEDDEWITEEATPLDAKEEKS